LVQFNEINISRYVGRPTQWGGFCCLGAILEESLDRYGLVGQFNFLVADGSFSSMKSVVKHLRSMEKAVADASKSVDSSGLAGQFKSAARSLDTASGSMAKSLQPLKAEFRALKATAANIDFGDVLDDRQFKKATTAVNAYVKNLKELRKQVQGETAAEREFTEVLKRQQRVIKDKLALHDAERKAAFFSQRKGEFGALNQVGNIALNPLKQAGKEAIQVFADFDDKMSAVAAISRATGKDLDRLREKAKLLGATTRFTAGEAADAEKYLAAAGFNAQQIFAGVPATLDLASAGQLGLAESADIASNVLSGMRMGVSDLGHITDVMALSAASANTNIQQLGVAMSYAAPNAALFGAGIEETSALIGVMSNAGIQADKAGTAARGAFLKLAAPTLRGRMALNEYGISLTDTSGKMRNIVDVMQDIGTNLQLDPASLDSIIQAGDDVEKLGQIAQSKQITALKDIFGTTGISGASAAIGQMQEFTRLSLAGRGSSFAVEDYEKLFKSQGIDKLATDKDVFTSLLREAGNYQNALQQLDAATIALVKSNEYLGNLSSAQLSQLSGYFQIPEGENLFDAILTTAPDANAAVSKLTSAMGELGIEFKGKSGAAKTMAQVMENNLAGSFRSLSSAFEAVQVNLIEPIAPIVRAIADASTKLLLAVANLPSPVRGLIAGVGVLAAGFAAVSVAVGTVGVVLFGFSQAAATATAAGIALQASVIPLTGFFPAAMGAFEGTASNPFKTASFAAEAFSDTIASTSRDVNFGLSGIARNIAVVSRSLASMSVSFALSPLGIAIASFLALNAILEQINPEINLLGTIFSAVSSVAGFAVGIIQGFTEALLAALDIPTSVAGSVLTAPFAAVSSAIEYATAAFEAWRKSGRAIGGDIFKFVAQPFQLAGKAIENSWNYTLNYIKNLLTPFADFVAQIGKLLQGGLAEASPGPTYMIREKWDYTIAFLEKLFIRIRNAAGLVNRAFLGIGDITESSRMEAQQQLLGGAINLVANSVRKLSVIGEAVTKIRDFERGIIDGVKENFDFLSFTLLTLSSLPLTLLAQLEEGAALIVPELAFIIGEGIPRAFLYAMPGLIAIATSTGLIRGIERGFMGAIDAMPEFLEKTSDKIFNSLSVGMKQKLNEGLSEGLTTFTKSMPAMFPGGMAIDVDIDKTYLAIKDFIRGPLVGLIAYLHRVGDLSKEIGKEIYAGIEPILSFNPFTSFPLFSALPPLIPLVTAILPMEKALVSLAKSPSVQGIMGFLTGTVLPAALRTISAISSLVIFTFNAIVTLPVLAVLQEIISKLTPITDILRAISLNAQSVAAAVGRTMLLAIDRAVIGIAGLILEIPYIGKHLSAAFLVATKALGGFFQLIVASAPRYLNLLLRFFPTKQLVALFSSYRKIFTDLMSGAVYAFREGLSPVSNILMKALNPAAAFKFLAFYIRTKGLAGIIKKGGFGGLSQIFNLANYINPVDIALGLNRSLNEVARLVSGSAVPLDFISRKQAEIFQVLATPAARRLAEREKRLVSLVEILESASGPMKVFIKLVQGLMMVSPIVQIVSRLGLTMLFWYNILKPVNQEMLDAIANTRLLGVSLMPVAKVLEVMRFVVVDLGEVLFRFLKAIPGMAATVMDVFDKLGTGIGVTVHEIVGVSSILANVFKFSVINPLAGVLLAAVAVADGVLIAILATFKLIRLKTQQYGDAIAALLRGNFVPLVKQIFSDLFGVINFGFQQTAMRAVGAIAYLGKTVGAIVGASAAEIVRLIRDPIGEITRLTELFAKNLVAATAGVMVYVRQLQLDKLVRFAADFWPEILAVASVLGRIYGLLSPIQFAIVGLIELGGFLSYEYATGFQTLDKIITALQHPIDALNVAMQGIAGFLGLYVSPDLTGFIGNLAEQFVKFLPVIGSGVFAIALLLTRNIGGAFQMISSNVLLFVGRILQVSEAIAGVGDRVKQVASSANVQVGLSEVANKVRRRSTVAGIANPLAYSQDFQTQQQATMLGDQRVGKSKAALRYQKELAKAQRQEQALSERALISEVKRGTDFGKGLADAERRYYLKDKNGITEGVSGAAVEKRRNRFGIEQYQVTDIGRQLLKMSGRGGENVKAGRGLQFENIRREAAKRSGLDAEFSRFGNAPSNEELVKLAGGKNVAIDLLNNFQKAMANLHVEDIKAEYLYVSKTKLPQVSKDKPDSERAFDIQLSRFKDKGDKSIDTAASSEKIRGALKSAESTYASKLNAFRDSMMAVLSNIRSSDRPGKPGTNMFGEDEIKAYAAQIKTAKTIGETLHRGEYEKVVKDVINKINQRQADFIAVTIPSFKEFESANKQAAKELQEASGRSRQVVTGFGNVAVEGVRNLGTAMQQSSNLLEGQVTSTRNTLARTFFGWTGIPKILESMRFDKTIAIQARIVQARTEKLIQSEASAALLLKRARERGLDALVKNNPIHGNLDGLLRKLREPEHKQLHQFFNQFIETGKFQREATGQEITKLTGMLEASFGEKRSEFKGVDGLKTFLDRLKSAPDLNKEDIQKLRRFLTHGTGDRGKQLKETDFDTLQKQLTNAGIGGKDELNDLRNSLRRDDSLAAVFDQYLLTGKFVLKASQEQQEQIASLIGLSSARELKNIDKVKLKNPLEQLKVNVQVFLENLDAGFERFNRSTIDKIDSLESKLIKIPFMSVEMAENIVRPLRNFYSGIYKSALSAKDSSIKLAGDLYKAAEVSIKGSKFVQRIEKLNKDFRTAQRNSLEHMMTEGREKAPKTHYQFMGQMFAELTKTDIKDRKTQDTILQSILKDQKDSNGNNISIKDRLNKLGMSNKIEDITKALGKALDVNEARAREIIENPNYTAKSVAPYQVFFAKAFPELIKNFTGGVTALAAKTGAGGLVKKIVADISPVLGKPVLIGISSIIDRARIAMSVGTNRIAREVEGLIGTNPFSNFLNNFSRFLARSGDSMSKFFVDRASGFDAERAKSWTVKIVDKAGELFKAVAGVLGQAGNQARSQQGGILGAIGNLFSGIKNFFSNVFGNKDIANLQKHKAAAERLAQSQGDSRLGLAAKRRAATLGDRIEYTKQFNSPASKAKAALFGLAELLKTASQKVGQGADALNARSRQAAIPQSETTIREASRGGRRHYRSLERRGLIDSADVSIDSGMAEYGNNILPLTEKISASILKGASSAARGISTYFQGAATRTETAWQEATNRITGNNWWTMVKRAAWAGVKIVSSLNHRASDVTSAAWKNTEHSTTANMNQMAQAAAGTGAEIARDMQRATQVTQQSIARIPQAAEQATTKSVGFFHKLVGAVGGVGKAGMAVGGAVTAAGFAAQTAFFSLQNMGFIDEETAQSLYKVTELFTLIGAVGGLAAPVLAALGASFGAIVSVSGATIAGLTGIGGAIAGAVGAAALPLAPLIAGVAAIGLAAGGLYLAFKNNFLGIGSLARSAGDMLSQALSAPIAFVTAAWQRFIDAFGGKLMAIVQPALNVAQGLINALNHNPTEKIPTAWEGAVASITGSIQGMVAPAKGVGEEMSESLQADDAKQRRKTEFINSIALGATGEKQKLSWQDNLQIGFGKVVAALTSVLSPLDSVGKKLDTQAQLLHAQIRQQQTAQAQTLWRFATNKERNKNLATRIEAMLQRRFSREAPPQLSHSARSMGGFVQRGSPTVTAPAMLGTLQQSGAGKSISKFGNLLKPIFGLGMLGELGTLILGIGGITTALSVLTLAFTTDFADIRTKTVKLTTAISNLFSGSVQAIQKAWTGFVHWFLDMPLVDTALEIALGLIDALNHNPTEKIPTAWEGAVERISGAMNWLLTPAKEVAGILTGIFSPVGNFFSGKAKQANLVVSQGKEAVVNTKNSLTNTYVGMEGFFTQGSRAIESELYLHRGLFVSIVSTLDRIAFYTKSLLALLDKPQEETRSLATAQAPDLGKSSVSAQRKYQIGLGLKGEGWEKRTEQSRQKDISNDLDQQKRGWNPLEGIPLLDKVHIPDFIEIRNVFDKESAFRTQVQTQMQKEELKIADTILQGLNSKSLSSQAEYAGLATKITVQKKGLGGLLGQTEDVYKINQAGQKYIEEQLAASAKNQEGMFSNARLSATAASVGAKIPDRALLDKALVGQDSLNDAIKLAPGQPGKSQQIVQLEAINSVLGEILMAINTLHPPMQLPVKQAIADRSRENLLPLEVAETSSAQKFLSFLIQGIKENAPKIANSIQGTVKSGIDKTKDFISSRKQDFIEKKTYLAAKAGAGIFSGAAPKTANTVGVGVTGAIGLGDLGAASTNAAWVNTASAITANINSLVQPAEDSGYELQKAVSEGSPGPTYWIRHYWEKTVGAIGGWMGDIQANAKETGSILRGNLTNSASEILLSPPTNDLKSQAIRAASFFALAVGDRYQYLADRGVGSASILFAPGMEYVTSSLSQLGNDLVDFVGRSAKALLTLNFVELGDAARDFFGNFKYGVGGVLSGFNSMSLSAIAFGLFSLSGISPLLLVLGGVAFTAAVIAANFLGIRTILTGLIKIGIGAGKILAGALWGLVEAAGAFKTIALGILPALKGDFTLIQEGFRGLGFAFENFGRSADDGLKVIARGSFQVLRGIGEAIEQVFRPLGFTLKRATESINNFFLAFKSGEQAGEMVASILINAVKSVTDAVAFAIDSVKHHFPAIKQLFAEQVDLAVQSIKNGIFQVQESIKNFTFKDAITGISQLFGSIDGSSESIPDRLKRLVPGITEALTAPLKYVGDFWRGFFNTILVALPPDIAAAVQKGFGGAISAVESKFRQIMKMLNVEEYFDRAIVKVQSSWQQLGDWLRQSDLFRVAGDRLREAFKPENISQAFLSTVNILEAAWSKFVGWMSGTNLFSWLFDRLLKVGLEFTLFSGLLREKWSEVQKSLATGQIFQGFFDRLKDLSGRLSAWAIEVGLKFEIPAIQNLFVKIALLGERLSNTVAFIQEKWNKLSVWLSETPMIPGALDFLTLIGTKFGETISWIKSEWPNFITFLSSADLFTGISAKMKNFGESIPSLFEKVKEQIAKIIPSINGAIASVQAQWQRLTEFLNRKDLFLTVLTGLQDFSSRVPQLFEQALQEVPIAFGKAADWIKRKWEKFAAEFQTILTPIADFAKWLGQTLIGLLNHSPTVKIPEAWKEAVTKITNSLLQLIAPATWVATQIIAKFNLLDVIKNGFKSLNGFISNFATSLFSEVQQPLTDLIGIVISASKSAIDFGQTLFDIARAVNSGAIASDEMTSKLTGVSSAVRHLGEFLGWILKNLGQFSQGLTSAGRDTDRAASAGKDFGQVVGKILAGIVNFSTTVLPPLFKVLWVFTQIGIELSAFALKFVWAFRFVLDWPARVMTAVLGLYKSVLRFVALLSSFSRKSKEAFAGVQEGFASFKAQLAGVALTASEIAGSFLGFAKDIGTFGLKMAGVVAEILVGLKDVGVALFKLGLDVSLPFDIFSVFKGIPDIIASIGVLGSNATELKGRLMSELGELGAAIAQFLEQPLKTVGAIWEKTGGKIVGAIAGIGRKAKQTGQQLQGDLSEASPGPTYWIRKNWVNTTETIQSRLSDLALSAKIEGNAIYRFLDRSLTALSPSKIAEAGEALGGLKFDAKLAMSSVSRNPVESQTNLHRITARQVRLNDLYKQGAIDSKVYTQGLKNLESAHRRVTLAVEQDTAARKQVGESVRSLSLSIGSVLSNIAPQLATPIFMMNDLVTSFLDIRTAMPGMRAFYATNAASSVAADSAIAASALTKAGIVGGANGAIAASYGFVAGAAKLAYKSMIVPLLPFLPLILGISSALFLLYRSYKDNIGGIQEVVENAKNSLGNFSSWILESISSVASAIVGTVAGIIGSLIQAGKFAFTVFGVLVESLLRIGAALAVFSSLTQIGGLFVSAGAFVAGLSLALIEFSTIATGVAGIFSGVLVPVILSGLSAILASATAAISPFLPFIPLLLGIVAVGWVLGKVFSFIGSIVAGVFGGIWDSIAQVTGTLFQEIDSVWSALVELGNTIVEPFAQIFGTIASIFSGVDGNISGLASSIINVLLIPVKTLTFSLIKIIKTISFVLIGVIKTLGFVFNAVSKIVRAVATVGAAIAGTVVTLTLAANFGAVLAGITGAVGAIGSAVSGVGSALATIGGVFAAAVVPAVTGGIGAVIAGISAAVVAAAPFLAIISGVVAVGWVLKETFVVVGSAITRVFQGIWNLIQWVVTNSMGVLANIPFVGGLFAPSLRSQPLPSHPLQVQPVQRYATGGLISGMGTSTGDRVPILASPGEFVVNAAATRSNLPLLESINQGDRVEVSSLRALPVPATPIPLPPAASSQTTEFNVQFVFGDIVVQGANPSFAAEELLGEIMKHLESPQAQRVIRTQLRDIVEKAKQ
jgi:TP901 family phage tail tape measure protein